MLIKFEGIYCRRNKYFFESLGVVERYQKLTSATNKKYEAKHKLSCEIV
jgi:hypothetical protein